MAKETWGQHFSNDEKLVFQKGDWSVTEDGEKTWSLYFQGQCVEPVLDYNQYKLFSKGFLLFAENGFMNSYALFSEEHSNPIYKVSGKNVFKELDKNLLTIYSSQGSTKSFDTLSLMEITICEDNQIGFNL